MEGVGVEVPPGFTAGRLVRERLSLETEALQARVGTVCLNGSPVDDLEACHLGEGERIAVSGPLPGLAGACLRRGSVLAGMRASITQGVTAPARGGTVTVCLFNTMLTLAGRTLLGHGVLVGQERLREFLAACPETLWANARTACLDGRMLASPLRVTVAAALPAGTIRMVVRSPATSHERMASCASS